APASFCAWAGCRCILEVGAAGELGPPTDLPDVAPSTPLPGGAGLVVWCVRHLRLMSSRDVRQHGSAARDATGGAPAIWRDPRGPGQRLGTPLATPLGTLRQRPGNTLAAPRQRRTAQRSSEPRHPPPRPHAEGRRSVTTGLRVLRQLCLRELVPVGGWAAVRVDEVGGPRHRSPAHGTGGELDDD